MFRHSMRYVITFLAFAAIPLMLATASAQGPGGRMGGGRHGGPGGGPEGRDDRREMSAAMRALDLGPMWAVLSFESGASGATLESLRPAFADAWKQRVSVLEHARDDGKIDWQGVGRDFEKTRRDLDAKVKAALSADEMRRFEDAMERLDDMRPRRPGPPR